MNAPISPKHAAAAEQQIESAMRNYAEAGARIKTLEDELAETHKKWRAGIDELTAAHCVALEEIDRNRTSEVARLVDSINRLEATLAERDRAYNHVRQNYDNVLAQRDHYMAIVQHMDTTVDGLKDAVDRVMKAAHDAPFTRQGNGIPVIGHTEEGDEALRQIVGRMRPATEDELH